jgi:hypothetical protein
MTCHSPTNIGGTAGLWTFLPSQSPAPTPRDHCGTPGLSDSGGAVFYAAWAGACSASNWVGDWRPRLAVENSTQLALYAILHSRKTTAIGVIRSWPNQRRNLAWHPKQTHSRHRTTRVCVRLVPRPDMIPCLRVHQASASPRPYQHSKA